MGEDDGWSDAEFEAAVEAYLRMLGYEQRGEPYQKAAVSREYRDGPLAARSKQSFDYRMRNISAVMQEHGEPWLRGYVPAEHVGEPSRRRIRRAFELLRARAARAPQQLSSQTTAKRRVWLKAFWGFDPTQDGYLGFTRPGDRNRFIREHQPGDLVLIYGADTKETDAEDRRQALGFLECEPIPVTDRERCSQQGWDRKVAMGCGDRWTHAVPVRRAWRVERRIQVKHIAPDTYTSDRARVIASQGEILSADEALVALQLPVIPMDVFGEPPLEVAAATAPEQTMNAAFSPSKGFTPSFGQRESNYVDGDTRLYMLVFAGEASALLGREVGTRVVVKVGLSNNPKQRCEDHNQTLPPAAATRWLLSLTSKPFPSGVDAKLAEDHLKARFADRFKSLGGEFFLGKADELESAFYEASRPAAFFIKGASKKASA
ncbi:hypothetical protein [Phenylobacterium sp. NIBR 498073]|uniref:hypothetical protein n=1 Tax=Phenylobacterium sp. NIBR 498073 TaxID=3015177 RepID=UPI0022B58871|nr:hypothetical protein [Phenylobacterium sp. NIBR 498073]WGU41424.1 hypothetical protein O4N75_06775 [Phenylobacterium sp. NIBR 498073]